MVRPLRLEYEDAYYHVMNRGRGRQRIFHDSAYYQAFLQTLSEAHGRFGIEILCYCLMGNHYHLLLKTPEGNLSRAMRHIGGVYTQRYNRLKRTDGSLFRGRYKAIVVESDSYQLQLSRYIHRNPLEAKIVTTLEDYPWSSYPAFINKADSPAWLCRDEIYSQLSGSRQRYARYKAFVELGTDEEIARFYGKGNVMSVLGSEGFREWAYSRTSDDEEVIRKRSGISRLPIQAIVDHIANEFGATEDAILTAVRGRGGKNLARWIAMYVCQELGGHRLKAIAKAFKLRRYATVSTTISKLKKLMQEDHRIEKQVIRILLDLTP